MHFGYFVIGLGLVAVLVIITSIAMFPDIVRYIKISRM
jgi:hypothetical protein